MSLFDFVQEDNRIWRPAHAFCELATFFVADIVRRRADELGNGMFFHTFRHIESTQRFCGPKHELSAAADICGFADAGGTEENKRANRTRRQFQSSAAAAYGASQRGN